MAAPGRRAPGSGHGHRPDLQRRPSTRRCWSTTRTTRTSRRIAASFRQHLDEVPASSSGTSRHGADRGRLRQGLLPRAAARARAIASPASIPPTRATTPTSSRRLSSAASASRRTASSCATCSSTCAIRSTSWQASLDANGGAGTSTSRSPASTGSAQHRAWFDIFYEHVNYFRLDDFRRMFGTVHRVRPRLRRPVPLRGRRPGDAAAPAIGAERPRRRCQATSCAHRRLGPPRDQPSGRTAIWGGASKGVIFSLLPGAARRVAAAGDRHQSRQAGPLPARHRPAGASPRMALARARRRRHDVRDELQLPRRNHGPSDNASPTQWIDE